MAKQSPAYQKFTEPLNNGTRGGFDIHIYFHANHPYELQFAKDLRERIRREFPELRVYKLWEKNIGPHGLPMFEVSMVCSNWQSSNTDRSHQRSMSSIRTSLELSSRGLLSTGGRCQHWYIPTPTTSFETTVRGRYGWARR